MPFQTTPKTGSRYTLVAFSAGGSERTGDPDALGGLLSERLLNELKTSQASDLFLFSHGWRGDINAAVDQYNRWIDAMAALSADAARMGPEFKPLWVGVHWPSEPWGDEAFGQPGAFATIAAQTGSANPQAAQNSYLERLDLLGSEEAKSLLQFIFDQQREHAAARALPPEVASAYQRLAALMNFEPKGAGAEPGNDTAQFDPESAFEAMNGPSVAFGGSFGDGLLAPLRTLSFWNMKRRARSVGGTGVNKLVSQMQALAPNCAVHLMGHSFGTIVVSSACGQAGAWLPRPIDSLALIQGAVSLWSFADKVQGSGGPGYYNAMCRKPAIRGPVITTQSRFDLAVSRWYKAAVGLVNATPDFGDNINLIKWGAIGQYGIQGLSDLQAISMLDATEDYGFADGKIFNIEASKFICKGGGFSGAHSDIDGPAVAHALWQVALASKAARGESAFATAAFDASAQTATTAARAATAQPAQPAKAPAPAMPIPFGVHAQTGTYLPPIKESDLEHIGKDSDAAKLRSEASVPVYGAIESVKSDDLALAGWGVLFAAGMKQDQKQVRDALQPLLDLRKQEAGTLYYEFSNDSGYAPGLSADDWLSERGSALAPVDPKQGVPYYLLIVGSPDDIPFDFQYDLDTFFAVGRLYFDGISEYRRYADNMCAYETAGAVPHGKSVAIFAARNPGDAATQLLHDLVGAPMALGDGSLGLHPMAESHGYTTTNLLNDRAKKENLQSLLRGGYMDVHPALLFTGSHGVAFGPDDPDQRSKQGAILTAEWQGPRSPAPPETYLTAAEITGPVSTLGMIYYFFACYSAGCPEYDTYSYGEDDQPVRIAGAQIMARLPQQILLNGAQAVIGHVDRAWAYSFQTGRGVTVAQNVRDPMDRILAGRRVGDAMDSANQRWSVLSNTLTKYLDRRKVAKAAVSNAKLANAWVERDDARNYVILGDPASRLREA